jgi:hypothetical protein
MTLLPSMQVAVTHDRGFELKSNLHLCYSINSSGTRIAQLLKLVNEYWLERGGHSGRCRQLVSIEAGDQCSHDTTVHSVT